MVALLIRLQIKLNLRSFSGDWKKIAGLIILSLYGATLVIGLMLIMVFLRGTDPNTVGGITTLLLGIVTFAYPVLYVLFGANDPLAISKFALLPVNAKTLRSGLVAATVISFAGIIITLISVGYVYSWSATWPTLIVALISALCGIVFTIVLIRMLTTAMFSAFKSRKFRDLILLISGAALLIIIILPQLFVSSNKQIEISASIFDPSSWLIVKVIKWTPFGWAWSLPWDFAVGAWVSLITKALLLIGLTAVLWWAWGVLLDRALTSPLVRSSGMKKIKTNGVIDKLMPQTPVGAIGARTIRYWLRDPRRKILALSLLLLPVLLGIGLLKIDGPSTLILIVPLVTLAFGCLNIFAVDLCYDGAALWMQIVTRVRGREDRLGRFYGLAFFMGILGIVLTVASLGLSGRWDLTVLCFAVNASAVGVMSGIGLLMGAIWVYRIPPSKEGMFSQRGSPTAAVAMLVAMLVGGMFLIPIVILAICSLNSMLFMWITILVSLIIGSAVLWFGVVVGGRYLDSHWPETLKAITWARR